MSKSYSIGLMTYEYRFDSHFMPLLGELNKQRQNVEKIVFINGQHNQPFNQNFRRKALNNTAYYDNTFLHMSPVFRSFSHMVNTNINLSSNEDILIMSDDVSIDSSFLSDYENRLSQQSNSFIINGSFAHFSINRKDIFKVGYFDERLLGMGHEDGEWDFRYAKSYNVTQNVGFACPNVSIPSVSHKDEKNNNECKNQRRDGKYSKYNREFVESEIIVEQPEHIDGEYTRQGTYGRQIQMKNNTVNFYPGQIHFWENKDKL